MVYYVAVDFSWHGGSAVLQQWTRYVIMLKHVSKDDLSLSRPPIPSADRRRLSKKRYPG